MSQLQNKIFWITGSFYHRKNIISKIKEKLSDFETIIFHDDSLPETIEMELSNNSLFSSKKLIILKAIPQFSSKSNDKWNNLLSNLSNDVVLIFDNVEPKSRSIIFKHVQKIGKVIQSDEYLSKEEAGSTIREIFEKHGKTVEDKSIDLIVNNIGIDTKGKGVHFDTIVNTVEQICFYIGKKKKIIEHDDVVKTSKVYNNFIIWDIFQPLDNKDFFQCQKTFLKACEDSSAKDATNSIFYMLLWRYRLLLFLKESMVNKSQQETLSDLKGLRKKTNDGIKSVYNEYTVNSIINARTLDKYTRSELFKIVNHIDALMLKMRYDTKTEEDFVTLIDNLFAFVCKTESEAHLIRLRETE